jgi:hypothetical protein
MKPAIPMAMLAAMKDLTFDMAAPLTETTMPGANCPERKSAS